MPARATQGISSSRWNSARCGRAASRRCLRRNSMRRLFLHRQERSFPRALKALQKGGALVLGGIHMSPIPSFDYDLLYQERVIRSVANNTRQDGEDFLRIAAEIPIRSDCHSSIARRESRAERPEERRHFGRGGARDRPRRLTLRAAH